MTLLLISLGLIIDIAFIINDDKYHNWVSIILKSSASLCFVLLSIWEARNLSSSHFAKLIWASLICDFLGDFVLILRNVIKKLKGLIFTTGTLLFLLSHVFLTVFLYLYTKINIISVLIITLVLTILSYIFILGKLEASTNTRIMGVIYFFSIFIVWVYSVVLCIKSYSLFSLVFMIGYFLFMVSDIILSIQKFSKNSPKILQPTYRILYYISQIIIAMSVSLL